MKKILQGRYALTCTKEEAIRRLQEMEGYSYQDSEILKKVLEERVNAVNRWDA